MPKQMRLHVGLLLALFSPLAHSVSLSDFTPRNTNLGIQCNTVYTEQILGCQASDFTASNPNVCSNNCINGLLNIQAAIQSKCATVTVSETSMVGLFLLGTGIQVLCPNFKQSASTTASPVQSSTFVSSSSVLQSAATSAVPDQSSSQALATPTSASALPSTTDGVVVDTTNSPAASSTSNRFVVITPTSSASTAKQSQKSNADSGGGSPFDVQATSGANALSPCLFGLLYTVLLLGAMA